MRESHRQIFHQVAQELQCWIGVREPNPLADKWMGTNGCVPKMSRCKAKTADNADFQYAGLVVDPTICEEAFKATSLQAALNSWRKLLIPLMQFKTGRELVIPRPGQERSCLPVGFTKIETGPQQGLVQFNDSFIHSDYDLMAVNRSNESGEFLQTSRSEQAALYEKAGPMLNRGLGTPMVQHGPELDWDQGVGAKEFEMIFWFGPGNRFNCQPSSMPHGGH